MGWNTVEVLPWGQTPKSDRGQTPNSELSTLNSPSRCGTGHPVFAGLDGQAFYFVHSYYVGADCPAAVCHTEYAGFEFTSAIATGSLVATQFHPERSGEAGLRLLRNFLAWEGSPCC